MTAPLLAVRNLSKRFAGAGRNVVDGVSLDLAAGEILALVGPSGCGKSTTLRMIAGFETPDAGSISVASRDIGALAPEKRGIGMVFQDYALFPHMTVGANVLFGARQRDGDEAARFLDMVGLAGFEARYPDELSGGQQQRVALARSFAARPSLLLLDEPFSNLDAALRSATRREIRRLLKDAGLGILFVTHDQEEAMSFADRIAVMRDGQVLQTGRAQEVYDQPANMFVAGFLGRSNFIDGVADGAYCDTSIGRLPLAAPRNGAVRLALRPENIAIAPAEGQPGNGRVVGVEFKGHDTTYWVASGGLELQVDVMQGRRLAEGAEVRLSVNGAVVALD